MAYCMKLTGITQSDVGRGKKCNNAFRDIGELCKRYFVDYIFPFGNADKGALKLQIYALDYDEINLTDNQERNNTP